MPIKSRYGELKFKGSSMHSLVKVAKRKVANLYRREVLKDQFLIEAKRWFKDRGDTTHRLNYDLDATSTVLDLGGYLGDFAADISAKFGASVFLFEPVPEYYQSCVNRFRINSNVRCFCYGLGSVAQQMPIAVSANESSFINKLDNHRTVLAEIKPIGAVIQDLGIRNVDLLKINIEGGEYDVIPACISEGIITDINNIQVQFHNFIPDAVKKREEICARLSETHVRTWCYDFIWENWELRK